MKFEKNVNRILHDEHMMVQSLLGRFGGLLTRFKGAPTLDAGEPGTAVLLNELIAALERDVDRHFRFEEEALFPELEAAGEADLAAALREDHEALRPMAKQIAGLARRARSQELTDEEWRKFRQVGGIYVQDQIAHAEREEMALLPLLETCLDDDKDVMLCNEYIAGETRAAE